MLSEGKPYIKKHQVEFHWTYQRVVLCEVLLWIKESYCFVMLEEFVSIQMTSCPSPHLEERWAVIFYIFQFHKIAACTALFFSLLHTVGHIVNFYHVSTQPVEHLRCLTSEVHFPSDYKPGITFWLFQTITGWSHCYSSIYCTQQLPPWRSRATQTKLISIWVVYQLSCH